MHVACIDIKDSGTDPSSIGDSIYNKVGGKMGFLKINDTGTAGKSFRNR